MEYFLRHGGETILDALLAHLAPLGWQHINLIGELPLDFTLARQIRNIVPQKG